MVYSLKGLMLKESFVFDKCNLRTLKTLIYYCSFFPPPLSFLVLFFKCLRSTLDKKRHLRSRAVEVQGGRKRAILNLVTVRFRSLRSSLWVSGIVSVLSACKRAADGWGKCSLICSACTAANQH